MQLNVSVTELAKINQELAEALRPCLTHDLPAQWTW